MARGQSPTRRALGRFARNRAALAGLVLLVLYIGVFPSTVMDKIGPSSEKLVADYQAKLAEAHKAETVGAENTAKKPKEDAPAAQENTP